MREILRLVVIVLVACVCWRQLLVPAAMFGCASRVPLVKALGLELQRWVLMVCGVAFAHAARDL